MTLSENERYIQHERHVKVVHVGLIYHDHVLWLVRDDLDLGPDRDVPYHEKYDLDDEYDLDVRAFVRDVEKLKKVAGKNKQHQIAGEN